MTLFKEQTGIGIPDVAENDWQTKWRLDDMSESGNLWISFLSIVPRSKVFREIDTSKYFTAAFTYSEGRPLRGRIRRK